MEFLKKTLTEVKKMDEETGPFLDNEMHANRVTIKAMIALIILFLGAIVLRAVGVFAVSRTVLDKICFASSVKMAAAICVYASVKKGHRWLKYMLMVLIISVLAELDCALTFYVPLNIVIPVILSCRYYSRKFTFRTALFTAVVFSMETFVGAKHGIGLHDLNMGPVTVTYARDLMVYSFLPKFLIFVLITGVCDGVAKRGRIMVQEQAAITAENSRIETEMDMAARIQKRSLPDLEKTIGIAGQYVTVAGSMIPAKTIGGDYYNAFMPDPTHLALMIADVSGKGIPAALFMMISKLMLDGAARANISPGQALTIVNHALCEHSLEDMFVTVWLGILDITTGELVSANAGHEYPMICRKGGSFEKIVDKHGLVLGGMDGHKYQETTIRMEPGDTLFLYTDGLPEAWNNENGQFGIDRVLQALDQCKTRALQDMIIEMNGEIDKYACGGPRFDDTTMLAVRIKKYMVHDGICMVPNKDSIAEVEEYIRSKMEAEGVPAKQANKMNVAVDEMYSNVVRYSGARWADAVCNVDAGQVTVRIRDNGIPYDPLKREAPDITLSADERKIGGLGIFMVRKMMDSVEYAYNEGRNEVTLKVSFDTSEQ